MLERGWYGMVLRVDERTAREVHDCGAFYGGRSGSLMHPDEVHFTLYQSDGMINLDVDARIRSALISMAEAISAAGNSMFSLSNLRVHGGMYLMWHANVSVCVEDCHKLAMDLLSPYVSVQQRAAMVARVKARNPSIRARDLKLVETYALEWVRWRNVPHIQCAYAERGLYVPPRSRREHRGVFTALELTSHAPNGFLRETIFRVPIVPR